jgi:toxin ParE1/3/4
MTFTISAEAATDLEDIWFYTAERWSVEQANRYVGQILDEIEYLSSHPESGVDYSHVRNNYFRAKIRLHFIFYRVNSRQENIEVIRVLHEMMDIDGQLS